MADDAGAPPHGLDPLATELRADDPDRFYTAMFAAEPGRSNLMALYAFNLEVARTRERVSEPMLGQIRLQWWREALDEITADKPRNHPVCLALNGWVGGKLSPDLRALFDQILTARENDLEDTPFATADTFHAYASATGGALLQLGMHAVGAADEGPLRLAMHIGTAYAITGLIRAIPFAGANGRVLIPQEIMTSVGATDAASRRDPERMRAAVAALTDMAADELRQAKAAGVRSRNRTRSVLLHRALAEMYLGRIRAAQHDLSDSRLDPGNGVRIARLLWRNYRLSY
ncbi:MAG: squalene/phytoene synthase family protein [Minwuia sp.]|nr:squalene/phytoene synthase family protein [Minwuia sp.]